MMHSYFDSQTKAGTLGGTLLTLLVKINNEDLIQTAVLAGTGAFVSLSVTILLKFIGRKIKKLF